MRSPWLSVSSLESFGRRIRSRVSDREYLRDILWQASGNTLAQVLGVAAMPLLTRLYGPSDFAALNLFTQVVAALAILLTLRFEYLVMVPAEQRESDAVLALVARLGAFQVLLWTPVLALLPRYWSWLGGQGALSQWMWLAPVSAWGVSLAVAFQQGIQRSGDFRTSARAEFAGRCAYVGWALIGALALPNIVGLMATTAANALGKFAGMWHAGASLVRSSLKHAKVPIGPSLKRMAYSTSLSSSVAVFSGAAPMLFIGERYGSNALGQYGLVVSTLYLPSQLLGQAIGQVYYQRACRLYADKLPFSELLIETSRNLAWIAVPIYGLIALLAPIAYPLVFGPDWRSAGDLARWLSLAAALAFISTPLDRTSMVVDAWWYLSAWHLGRAVTTAVVIGVAVMLGLTLNTFIALLAIQAAAMYLADWGASLVFSKRNAARRRHAGSAL